MSSSLAVVIPLSLPACWGRRWPSSQHFRGLPAGGLRPRGSACVWEQMIEGVLRPNGPPVSGLKIECQPLRLFPRLGSRLPSLGGLCLAFRRSAGISVCKWRGWNFSKGSILQKMKSKQLGMNGLSGTGSSL